jgi:hypothetical protein
MLSNTMTLAAATRCGTALLGVRTPAAVLATAGANHVRTQMSGTSSAASLAFRRGPAMPQQLAVMAADLRPASKNRKHNVYKTQIGAGTGAMGPQPEREPA